MEYRRPEIDAKKRFIAGLSRHPDKKLVIMDPALVKEIPEGVYCPTGLSMDEFAEFFSSDSYQMRSDFIQIVEQSTSVGLIYHLYALVKAYWVTGNRKVGNFHTFIDIGALVRYHYDLHGNIPNDNGEVMNATRVLNGDKFNTDLASFKTPWEMLTRYLSGKTIIAKQSQEMLWHQKFNAQRQPLPNIYINQTHLVYSFVLSKQEAQRNNPSNSTRQTPKTTIQYDYGYRTLSIWERELKKITINIDDVRRHEFPGKKYCDWEVVYRMARRYGQEEIPTYSFGWFDECLNVKEFGQRTSFAENERIEKIEEEYRIRREQEKERSVKNNSSRRLQNTEHPAILEKESKDDSISRIIYPYLVIGDSLLETDDFGPAHLYLYYYCRTLTAAKEAFCKYFETKAMVIIKPESLTDHELFCGFDYSYCDDYIWSCHAEKR